jgi:hypothetical protein
MIDLIPQDPAPWAARILALKDAIPFQAFSIVIVNGNVYPVTRPEYVEVTADAACAELNGPEDFWLPFRVRRKHETSNSWSE